MINLKILHELKMRDNQEDKQQWIVFPNRWCELKSKSMNERLVNLLQNARRIWVDYTGGKFGKQEVYKICLSEKYNDSSFRTLEHSSQ